MRWVLLLLGVALALFGATASAALVVFSRTELARAVTRRLRGGSIPLTELARIEEQFGAAAVLTSLGVVVVGAALPAILGDSSPPGLLLALGLVLVPVVLFGGHLFSRWLTEPRADDVLRRITPPLALWTRAVHLVLPARPVRVAGDLAALWQPRGASPAGDHTELSMIGGVMTFADRPVREVMTPRTDIVAVADDAGIEEIRLVFAQSGYSRIPVYRGTLDEVIGMLHAFDLFRLAPGDPLPIRPVAATPGSRSCGDLLLDMQRERRHLAVVLDEFGGTLGIVTLEDLLEELVGEIYDEHDEVTPSAGPRAVTVLEADGGTPVAAIEDRFGVQLPAAEVTIGGLLARRAGRIPTAGDRLTLGGLEFDVLQASPTRIDRLLIRSGNAPVQALDREGP